jgi:hypothetical protein
MAGKGSLSSTGQRANAKNEGRREGGEERAAAVRGKPFCVPPSVVCPRAQKRRRGRQTDRQTRKAHAPFSQPVNPPGGKTSTKDVVPP